LYEAEDEFEIIGSLETNGCTKGMSLNGELNEMENGMITQEGDIDVVDDAFMGYQTNQIHGIADDEFIVSDSDSDEIVTLQY